MLFLGTYTASARHADHPHVRYVCISQHLPCYHMITIKLITVSQSDENILCSYQELRYSDNINSIMAHSGIG